jgi:hypothetical protein
MLDTKLRHVFVIFIWAYIREISVSYFDLSLLFLPQSCLVQNVHTIWLYVSFDNLHVLIIDKS